MQRCVARLQLWCSGHEKYRSALRAKHNSSQSPFAQFVYVPQSPVCQGFSKPRFPLHLQDRLTGPTHVSGSELKVVKCRSRILKPGSRSVAKYRTPNDEECKPYCVTGPPRQIMPQS